MTIAGIVASIIQPIQELVPFLAVVAVVVFFIGILKYVYAVGKGKTDQSKDILVWGLVALFVIFSFWGILLALRGILLGQ